MAKPSIPPSTPVRGPNTKLISAVLSDPSLYPDEMKTWMPRFLSQNVNMQLQANQLPAPEKNRSVGSPGEAAFLNGWLNYAGTNNEPASYYSDPYKRVFLGGTITGGTVGQTAFVLPVGLRPRYITWFPTVSAGAFGAARVDVDGSVVPFIGSNTWFSLGGISFRQFG